MASLISSIILLFPIERLYELREYEKQHYRKKEIKNN
jgi:hypothetical protein